MSSSFDFGISQGFDFKIWLAIQQIHKRYGQRVDCSRKHVDTFGYAKTFGTGETEINSLARNEVHVTDDSIDSVSSSNAGDTGVVTYEGVTRVGNAFTFVSATVTLQGQTRVALPVPLSNITLATNSTSAAYAGDIYFYEETPITAGVPDNLDKAHSKIDIAENQSLNASGVVPYTSYFLITKMWGSVGIETAATANIRLKTQLLGNLAKTETMFSNSTSSYEPPHGIIVRPNSVISMTATCSTTSVEVAAGYSGVLLDIIP